MNTAPPARAALSGTSLRVAEKADGPDTSPPCCIWPRRRYRESCRQAVLAGAPERVVLDPAL
jgi:hypothetical protein